VIGDNQSAGITMAHVSALDARECAQTKVELAINLKAAKALGVNVPLPIIGRTDEVIDRALFAAVHESVVGPNAKSSWAVKLSAHGANRKQPNDLASAAFDPFSNLRLTWSPPGADKGEIACELPVRLGSAGVRTTKSIASMIMPEASCIWLRTA
jgi:hypothetical protein